MTTQLPSWLYTKQGTGGQTLLIITVFFLVISLLIVLGIANPVLRHKAAGVEMRESKTSFYLAESLMEDMVYRHLAALSVNTNETLTIDSNTANGVVSDVHNGKQITVTGDVRSVNRNVTSILLFGDGVTFNFGVQADVGGITLKNSASVLGNAYANGTITGADNMIYGSAVSAGPDGLIDDIHATGTAYAHNIQDAWIEGDAYYFATTTISNSIVEGTRYPNSNDQATTALPLTDELIQKWQDAAEDGGTATCTAGVFNATGSTSIGPVKIPCDLVVSGETPVVTLGGPVWVAGDITIQDQATFEVDSVLEDKSVAVVADDPNASTTKGTIRLQNNTEFVGAGDDSFILFVSQNRDAEEGGNNAAITVANNADGDLLLYAGHGKVLLKNFVVLREVSGYAIEAQNATQVIYESGLASLLFDSGPSGGLQLNSWKETADAAN